MTSIGSILRKATPGYNTRLSIIFDTDNRGKPMAYYVSGRLLGLGVPGMGTRKIKMSYDEAKLLVATGEADEIREADYNWKKSPEFQAMQKRVRS